MTDFNLNGSAICEGRAHGRVIEAELSESRMRAALKRLVDVTGSAKNDKPFHDCRWCSGTIDHEADCAWAMAAAISNRRELD